MSKRLRNRYFWCALFVVVAVIIFINLFLMSTQLKKSLNIDYERYDLMNRAEKHHNNSETMSLPTLYEHYTQGGVVVGLETPPDGFKLNKKDIIIFSGAIHYFRVHPAHWRDRLRKLRAAGFNTVETYVPWNLHEPEKDKYDFGDGDNDMSMFLDVVKFVQVAQEEDLFVIVRPGPYICAEWDFGGMPSWLLRDASLKVRTSESRYITRVTKYFDELLPLFTKLQFTEGGPILAFQIENEYGSIAYKVKRPDKLYLLSIKKLFDKHGLYKSLYFTADYPSIALTSGALDGVLMTANFNTDPDNQLNTLKVLQPNKPLMVMEYWSGWFDHWFEQHHTVSTDDYISILESILKFPSSVNLYMFHGGTSFGFLNGANVQPNKPTYQPDVSSYDYDAPLSEAGDYTEKYHATKELIARYNHVKTKTPKLPNESHKKKYPDTSIMYQLQFEQIIQKVDAADRVKSKNVTAMELLDINGGNGQSYGFVLYRKSGVNIPKNSVLKIEGRVHDVGTVMVDGLTATESFKHLEQTESFGFWEASDQELKLKEKCVGSNKTLDIMVENWGRVNFDNSLDAFDQKKGLWEGSVLLDGNKLEDWEIIALQFKRKWVNSLSGWDHNIKNTSNTPTLFKATLNIFDPMDTFLNMSNWGKGNVFINGFNLGRYFNAGPTHSLYVPAPLLKEGSNEFVVFELMKPSSHLVFTDAPILG
uniref:Beta-galactosidase n=2 Tax=Timema TaxID=61471 RepID=A0A7R9JRV5_TIMGE|nr:unnamed protein product [Timema genevievae]